MKLAISGTFGTGVHSWPLDVLPVRIGRDGTCQVQIRHGSVSRRHAEILRRGGLFLRDLSSKNGTRLNGIAVQGMAELAPGDRIEIGSISLSLTGRPEECMADFDCASNDQTTLLPVPSAGRDRAREPASRMLIQIETVGRHLGGHRTLPKLCDLLLHSIEMALPTSRVLVLARPEPGAPLKPIASRHRSDAAPGPPLLPEAALRDLLDRGKPVIRTRRRTVSSPGDTRVGEGPGPSSRIRSAMAAPLLHDGQALGLLYVESEELERGFTRKHLELLTLFANMAAVRLARERMQATAQMRAQMDRDLAVAGAVQHSMLPPSDVRLDGYQLAVRLEPCHAVGGDFVDVRLASDGAAWLLVGDVSGKGVPGAILMSLLLSSARVLYDSCAGPDALATRLNEILAECADIGHFATAFIARLDLAGGVLQYVNAGHPSPVIVLGRRRRALESTDPPLGAESTREYRTHTAHIAPGSVLAAFTDGLPDTKRSRGFFGPRRAEWAIRTASSCARLEKAAECLFAALDRFREGHPRGDDVAILLLRRDGVARCHDSRWAGWPNCELCPLRAPC